MRYLIDTNSLSSDTLKKCKGRTDVYIIEEILDEYAFMPEESLKIRKADIQVLTLNKKHVDRMIEVMKDHGGNLDLIRLYTSKGTVDVAVLAYILAERDLPDTLFAEEYTLITKDNPLTDAATNYGIKCLKDLP